MKISKKFLINENNINQDENQFFQTREDIENWLNEYNINNYTINDDLSVDVNGNVNIERKNIKCFPVRFRKVGWSFSCIYNQLTSLQGAPQEVGGGFSCIYNQLTSLQGAPQKVGRDFSCGYNQLTSLQGAPQEVGGGFSCSNNQLTSLQGAPQKVGGGFYCNENQLTSLQGAPQKVGRDFFCNVNQLTSLQGAPQEVGGDFYCRGNQLTSLQGAPQKVGGNFYCRGNQLTSLQGAPQKVGGDFYCRGNQLTSLQGAPQEVGGNFLVDDNLKDELEEFLKEKNKPQSHEKELKKKYNINSPSLYNIALQLSKKYEDDKKIPIKDLKKEMNSNNYLGQLFTKKDGQNFLRKYSNGFSINDIIKYDEENDLKDNFLKTLKVGTDLEIGFTVWNGAQKVFKEKNYVFQLNFSKEITEKLISEAPDEEYKISGEHEGVYHEIETSNKNNLKSYMKNSNHPTSKELLTMGWVRFTLFPEKHALVIDEIQTDLDDKEFLGQEIMMGWEDILMNSFIKYARNDLNYQKIYMPTYKTKLDLYSANPPMRLYKELPNRFGFKTKSDWEGFMLLEKKILSFVEFILK